MRKAITLDRGGRGGFYPKCDYYECEKTPTEKVMTVVGRKPNVLHCCAKHAKWFRRCEASFHAERWFLYQKYSYWDCQEYTQQPCKETDYGKMRDGGRVWQKKSE